MDILDTAKLFMWQETRARHSQETFDKHYKRAVPPRVLAAAASHPRRSELTADEVLFL